MSAILQLQDPVTLGDVLSSLYLGFFIYNYTLIVRNFNSFYFIQLMYVMSFSFHSKNQFSSKLHISHLYIGSSTLESCENDRNCRYLPQFIFMGTALFAQILVGCYARIYQTKLRNADNAKHTVRRIYFGFYSIVKASSIPIFFIFLDACIDLKDIIIAAVSVILLLFGLVVNLLFFRALTFLSTSTSKVKLWLDLMEYIVFYLSTLFSYLGFRYDIKHLNAAVFILIFIFCFLSWKIKDRAIKREQAYFENNNIKQVAVFKTINLHKKRQNVLQLIFLIVQVISFGLLIYYYDFKDDIVSSLSVDTIVFLVFSSLQFILILILHILRLCLEDISMLKNSLDDDVIPTTKRKEETLNGSGKIFINDT